MPHSEPVSHVTIFYRYSLTHPLFLYEDGGGGTFNVLPGNTPGANCFSAKKADGTRAFAITADGSVEVMGVKVIDNTGRRLV